MSFATVVPALAGPETPVSQTATAGDTYAGFIIEAAQRFAIPVVWIRAVMRVESRGDAHATSPKGAMGLMQIMPATWSDLRIRHGLGGDPYDARDNILAGAAYLRELHDRYGSPGFLAAYNAGPGRYEASLNGGSLPAETRDYVATLAPMLDDPRTGRLPIAGRNINSSWLLAPLFAAGNSAPSPARTAQSDDAKQDSVPASVVQDMSAIVPRSSGLFIARSGHGGAP